MVENGESVVVAGSATGSFQTGSLETLSHHDCCFKNLLPSLRGIKLRFSLG